MGDRGTVLEQRPGRTTEPRGYSFHSERRGPVLEKAKEYEVVVGVAETTSHVLNKPAPPPLQGSCSPPMPLRTILQRRLQLFMFHCFRYHFVYFGLYPCSFYACTDHQLYHIT